MSRALEGATTAILASVEEIEMAANLLQSAGPDGRGNPLGIIRDRVLSLYETCNFQDIAGQRIRKVVSTFSVVEQGIGRAEAILDEAMRMPASPGSASRIVPVPLSGPSLPGDPGHVSQADVDAFFS